MGFPAYKKIIINSHQKRLIYSQLDQLDFGSNPFVFEMNHLAKNQGKTIFNIESYLDEHDINTDAYPIIVIAGMKNYTGPLFVLDSLKKLPQFFKYKNRQLSIKEEQKLKLVELKQAHLANLQKEDYAPILEEYSRSHKKIYRANNESQFLKELKRRLTII